MTKDIIITISNLPPSAFALIAEKVELMTADLMRTMNNYQHLLIDGSTVSTTYQPSQKIENP